MTDSGSPEPKTASVQITELTRLRRCRHGAFLYFTGDSYIGGALDCYGEYSELEVEFLLGFIKPGDLVMEVGSNIGTITVPIARKVGSTGGVFAFEAQRVLYQMLNANLALNQLWNVMTVNGALGARHGLVRATVQVDYREVNNFGAVEFSEDGTEGEQIALGTLDMYPQLQPSLIKIDVEGMEQEVLRGGRNLIKTTRPLLYVENDRPKKSRALIAELQSLEYDMWWHMPPLFNPKNFYDNSVNLYPSIVSMNLFCVPKEKHLDIFGLKKVEDARSIPPGFERYTEWTDPQQQKETVQ